MKKVFVPVLLAALTFVACKKEEPKANEKTAMETETIVEEAVTEQPDSATVAKAWEVYMTPSKAHHMMAKDAGTWDADLTFWTPDNPEPQKSTSQAVCKMIMGGRYQENVHMGNMWGMPFEGRSITAFDNATEEFIST